MNASSLSRRRFLALAAASAGAGALLRGESAPPAAMPAATPVRPPALPAELVQAFVVAAHTDLPKTQELLAAHPSLKNACWDWGGGDFETALGGAAHMGRRDIAEFLLSHGSRLDVFAAAMLGRLDVVKAACAAFPQTPAVPGPHGIPLLVHARKGGPEASAVVAFLVELAAGGPSRP